MNKTEKNKFISKKYLLYAGIILGLLLIAVSFFMDSRQKDNGNQHATMLEEKLSHLLSGALGLDDSYVDVMISFENVKSTQENESTTIDFYTSSTTSSAPTTQKIKGAVIVLKCDLEPSDFEIIKKAASTALGTSQNKIYIIKGATDK